MMKVNSCQRIFSSLSKSWLQLTYPKKPKKPLPIFNSKRYNESMRRTNNDMYRQYAQETADNDRLRRENTSLRAENAELRRRVKTLEERIAKTVEEAVAKATAPLLSRIAELEATVASKDAEILRLKAQIAKDSSTSSSPPGRNGFKKIPNSREPSSRRTGGQPGHKGATLAIPQNLDELVEKGKAQHVVIDDTNGAEDFDISWVIDLKITPVYIERRVPKGTAEAVKYGGGVKGVAAYLMNAQSLPLDRTAEFLSDMTDGQINPSACKRLVEWRCNKR